MKRPSRLIAIGLTTTLFAFSSTAAPTIAAVRHRHHKMVQAHPRVESPQIFDDADPGAADAARNGGRARGLYAGAGGIFSPDYQVPDYGTVQLGAQLLGGGDLGKAYEDYYRHYYYYKYAYCPIGTGYVIYSRSCVGIGNLFQ